MGQRRTASVLFIDLVGSTEQRSRLGDDAADALRQDHDRFTGDAVTRHTGQVVKSTGDGLLAVFGSAADALDAAVAAQQAIAARNRSAQESIGLRTGVSIGDVSVEEGGDVFGTPVVEAARLCERPRRVRSCAPTSCGAWPAPAVGITSTHWAAST